MNKSIDYVYRGKKVSDANYLCQIYNVQHPSNKNSSLDNVPVFVFIVPIALLY